MRAAGVWRGYDLWPVLSPGSGRRRACSGRGRRDRWTKPAAALETLRPDVVVTYAEAGGWGRALMLEARRAGVASVGLQHGFIYRHWLNYQHEPDEMAARGRRCGFPRPDRTLVFDGFARRTLDRGRPLSRRGGRHRQPTARRAGRAAPRLSNGRAAAARSFGRARTRTLLVMAAKFSEIEPELPSLSRPREPSGRARVIKPHPAESPAVYEPFLRGQTRVTVAGSGADWVHSSGRPTPWRQRTRPSRSTPSRWACRRCVLGLPNNLSPFVDAGVMVGRKRRCNRAALEPSCMIEGSRGLLERARGVCRRAGHGAMVGRPSAQPRRFWP